MISMIYDKPINYNKPSFVHCRNNQIDIEVRQFCAKCFISVNSPGKAFSNCGSLYRHLIMQHSGTDKNIPPTTKKCIEELQIVSDQIIRGLIMK